MVRMTLLLLICVFASLLIQQCNYGCKGLGGEEHFKVITFKSGNFSKKSGKQRTYLKPDEISISPDDTLWINMEDSSIMVAAKRSNDGTLMACDSYIEKIYSSRWDSISIQSVTDFDAFHPAGSNMDSFFLIEANSQWKYELLNQFGKIIQTRNDKRFSLLLLRVPTNNSVQFKFNFFDTKTGESTFSFSPVLRYK